MTNSLFAGAGANVHGRVEPKAEKSLPSETADAKSEPLADSLIGVAKALSETSLNALSDVANKHGITPEAMKDIIAATLQAFNVNVHQPTVNLAEESFAPSGGRHAAAPRAEPSEARKGDDKKSMTPVEWNVTYADGEPNFAEGRELLQGLLRDRAAAWKDFEFSPYFQIQGFKYNPVDDTFSIRGRDKPVSLFARFKKAAAVLFDRYPTFAG